MDYLRAGYSAPARYIQNGTDTITLNWFRAAPGAKVFTRKHAFGSTVWDDEEGLPSSPGEIKQKYFTWNPTGPPPYPGTAEPLFPEYLLVGLPQALADTPCYDAALALNPRPIVLPITMLFTAGLAFAATANVFVPNPVSACGCSSASESQ